MYKTILNLQGESTLVLRLSDNAYIPFDPANTDYQQFKKDVLEGAELQDADGNAMTQEEAVSFIETLHKPAIPPITVTSGNVMATSAGTPIQGVVYGSAVGSSYGGTSW